MSPANNGCSQKKGTTGVHTPKMTFQSFTEGYSIYKYLLIVIGFFPDQHGCEVLLIFYCVQKNLGIKKIMLIFAT